MKPAKEYCLFISNSSIIEILFIMTSSNGNIFRVTGHLCGEFTGPWSPVNSLHRGQWRGAFMFSLICAWINLWINNREAGDLRCHHAHYDVIVMQLVYFRFTCAYHVVEIQFQVLYIRKDTNKYIFPSHSEYMCQFWWIQSSAVTTGLIYLDITYDTVITVAES